MLPKQTLSFHDRDLHQEFGEVEETVPTPTRKVTRDFVVKAGQHLRGVGPKLIAPDSVG